MELVALAEADRGRAPIAEDGEQVLARGLVRGDDAAVRRRAACLRGEDAADRDRRRPLEHRRVS